MVFEREYDVLIGGGGVAGAAAAVQCARAGLKTALVEKTILFGGLATAGLVNWYVPLCDGHGHLVTFGIAEEFLHASLKYGPWTGPPCGLRNAVRRTTRGRRSRRTLITLRSSRTLPGHAWRCSAAMSSFGIDVIVLPNDLIDPVSAPYLEGATIDFVFTLIGSRLTVLAPLRKLDTPDGRMAAKIQQVLAEQVNPSLAMHGGAAALIDVMDGSAFLELTGGCQGCSMADATFKNGIEKSLRGSVPEVQEVRDVTEHANGRNPYFQH